MSYNVKVMILVICALMLTAKADPDSEWTHSWNE